jgi:catechol 2,3-dioxygenase
LASLASPEGPIDSGVAIGLAALHVADLARSLRFYTSALGFQALAQAEGRAALGTQAGEPLLLLVERPGAPPKPRESAGLDHVAFLLPSRAALSRAVQRLQDVGHPIREFEDHLVCESVSLADPDGNGVELYRDRPRGEWPFAEGRVTMGSRPLDLPDLLAEAACGGGYALPRGSRVGHLHLQVSDLVAAEAFYCGALGFEATVRSEGALFVAAGGYHHHVGLNAGYSAGGPPTDAAGLRLFTLRFPEAAGYQAARARLVRAEIPFGEHAGGLSVEDRWGTVIVLVAGASAGADEILAAY